MKRPLILDISFYQDNPDTINIRVNFDKIKLNADGVIFRIGQAEWEDKKLKEYLDSAKKVNIPIGGYWYYDNRYSPEKQADLCSSIINKYNVKFNLPLFGDFEDRRVFSYMGWNNWYRFMERLKKNLPETNLGIYTGYYYWIEFCPREQPQRDYFGKYPLWIAQYPFDKYVDREKYTEPKIPENTWSVWDFWQVSDRGNGEIYGVESSRVDINFFNGSIEDLYLKYGFSNENGEVIETPPSLKNKRIKLEYKNDGISIDFIKKSDK